MKFTVDQLYVAYRKAKKEAFNDPNCAHGLKFLDYEENLSFNLERLLQELNQRSPAWQRDIDFLGHVTCIPKSISPQEEWKRSSSDSLIHCRSTDPWEYWNNCREKGGLAVADFRPVIDATVDFMVISALWVLEVGHLYDEKLDSRYALGNRLRRWRPQENAPDGTSGKLNRTSPDLFRHYFSSYGKWRADGLHAMRRDLEDGHRIVAITMDLKSFYHRVDASFLLDDSYLEMIGVALSDAQKRFTRQLIRSFSTWNDASRKLFNCRSRGLPVGLSASGLIANVLLHEFDQKVSSRLTPSYYARYVDDVFLVVRHPDYFHDGGEVVEWLGERLAGVTAVVRQGPDSPALEVTLPYAKKSELLFVAKKQKVFQLKGAYGIDLIGPIEEQIRRHTSEFRDLPHLPRTESEMAYRALLVTPDATLEPDALRKADVVMLRRSGFALLLRDVEDHARDLDRDAWETLRYEFYDLTLRHLLVPATFFDYVRYLPRVIGLMVVCLDWSHSEQFVAGLKRLFACLEETCKCEASDSGCADFEVALDSARNALGRRIVESILRSVKQNREKARELIIAICAVCGVDDINVWSADAVVSFAERLVLLDWSREPYAMRWLEDSTDAEDISVGPMDSLDGLFSIEVVEEFRIKARLPRPHWPALAFPTRPIPVSEITIRAPFLLKDGVVFSEVVRSLRGTWLPPNTDLTLTTHKKGKRRPSHLFVPGGPKGNPRVAITSIEVLPEEWAMAAAGRPSLTLERYQRFNDLLNNVISERSKPIYLVLPELALPRRWMMPMAERLIRRGVSLIAGVEYRQDRENKDVVHNEVLVALQTNFPGYTTGLFLLQPKCEPAWHERKLLSEGHDKSLAPPPDPTLRHPVYQHGDFCFGILVCSELTNMHNRCRFQGRVDALFVPEWNQDVDSFSPLVESASLDVHAFIVQANNRRYGDSRMRAPMKDHYLRDLIRVKGGLNDYYVVEEIDYRSLRRFQSHAVPPTGDGVQYKPFPVGFSKQLSRSRRTTPW